MEYVGRTVAKTFPGFGRKKFKGTVTAFDKKDPKLPFHIKYEDGDSEDISKEELLQVLVKEDVEQPAPKPGRGRPKKATEPAEEPKKAAEPAPEPKKAAEPAEEPKQAAEPAEKPKKAKPAEEPKKKRGREAAKEEVVADKAQQQQQQPADGEEVQGNQGKKSTGKLKGKKLRRSSPQRGGSSAGAGTAGAAAAVDTAAAAAGAAAERGGTAGASGAAAAAGGRAAPRGSASAGGETGNKSAEAAEAQGAGPSERRGGAGGRKKSKPSTSPSDLTNEAIEASQGLQDLITDVAAKSKARALNVVRFTGSPPAAAEAAAGGASGEGSGEPPSLKPLQSVAVTCGSLCFVSTIFPSAINALENEAPLDVVIAEYRRQAEQVLSQLEAELKNIGSTKQHLINVTVMLREIDRGMTPFATVWNEWVHPTALPAMNVYESFMDKEALVAVAAQAAVPPQLFD